MTVRSTNVQTGVTSVDNAAAPVFDTNPKLPNLSARQFKLGLVRNGISLTSIETLLNAEPDALIREESTIEWNYASSYERTHPLVTSLSASLGLTAAQVDAMWEVALTY